MLTCICIYMYICIHIIELTYENKCKHISEIHVLVVSVVRLDQYHESHLYDLIPMNTTQSSKCNALSHAACCVDNGMGWRKERMEWCYIEQCGSFGSGQRMNGGWYTRIETKRPSQTLLPTSSQYQPIPSYHHTTDTLK